MLGDSRGRALRQTVVAVGGEAAGNILIREGPLLSLEPGYGNIAKQIDVSLPCTCASGE